MIRNKQVTKDEFEAEKLRVYEIMQTNIQSLHDQFEKFLSQFPKKATNMTNCHHSYGHNLVNADNTSICFNIMTIRDCKYCRF